MLQAREIRRIGFSVAYDTNEVLLAKVKDAAPIDSRSKLERTSLLRFVSLLNCYGSRKELFNSYQHRKLTVFLKYKIISHSDISLKLILVLLSKICLDIKITGSYPESEKQLTYVY